uniref:Uncharacterized protein n=1 Tax=Anguilla anguilla TaxID=7936 RepID=A0A0E9WX65_ANGAN
MTKQTWFFRAKFTSFIFQSSSARLILSDFSKGVFVLKKNECLVPVKVPSIFMRLQPWFKRVRATCIQLTTALNSGLCSINNRLLLSSKCKCYFLLTHSIWAVCFSDG